MKLTSKEYKCGVGSGSGTLNEFLIDDFKKQGRPQVTRGRHLPMLILRYERFNLRCVSSVDHVLGAISTDKTEGERVGLSHLRVLRSEDRFRRVTCLIRTKWDSWGGSVSGTHDPVRLNRTVDSREDEESISTLRRVGVRTVVGGWGLSSVD